MSAASKNVYSLLFFFVNVFASITSLQMILPYVYRLRVRRGNMKDRTGRNLCRDHCGRQACWNPEAGHIIQRYANLKSGKNDIK